MDQGRRKFYQALGDELRAFAQKTFELNTFEDGVSYREMIEGLIERTHNQKRLAELENELKCPPLPEALAYIWQAFCRLSARRGSNGFSSNPISWPDIDAYVCHSKMPLAPWEVRIIEELDDLFRQEQSRTKD